MAVEVGMAVLWSNKKTPKSSKRICGFFPECLHEGSQHKYFYVLQMYRAKAGYGCFRDLFVLQDRQVQTVRVLIEHHEVRGRRFVAMKALT